MLASFTHVLSLLFLHIAGVIFLHSLGMVSCSSGGLFTRDFFLCAAKPFSLCLKRLFSYCCLSFIFFSKIAFLEVSLVITSLERLRQKDPETEASLGQVKKPCLKHKENPHWTKEGYRAFLLHFLLVALLFHILHLSKSILR